MYLFFNSDGQLLEKLDHGAVPKAGMTDFEIFAFFDGTNINSRYLNATLTLFKPDLLETKYPELLMQSKTVKFEKLENENSNFFINGKYYKGFYFDFHDFALSQTVEILFDISGVWGATINLFGQGSKIFTQGKFNFYVALGNELEDEKTIEWRTILSNIFLALANKLDINSSFFLRVVDELPETFDLSTYNIGDIIFNKSDNSFYKLTDFESSPELVLNVNDVATQDYVNTEVIANFSYNALTGVLKFFNKNGEQIGQDIIITGGGPGPGPGPHFHDASAIVSGIFPPERGGTGRDNLKDAGTDIIESLDSKASGEEIGGDGDYYIGKVGDKIVKVPISELKTYIDNGLALVARTGNFSDLNNIPTTLYGHHITDAYTKDEVNFRISAVDYLYIDN